MDSNTHLITAKLGKKHIAPGDIRKYQALTQGAGTMIRDGCAVSLYDANTVIVSPGNMIVEGLFLRVPAQVSLAIQSGAPGSNRNDLVVLHYRIDAAVQGDDAQGTGVSTMPLEVVPGTPVSGEPSDPPVIQGSIEEGSLEVQIPVARLRIRGLDIEEPEELITRYDPFGPQSVCVSGSPFNPAQAFGGAWEELGTHALLGLYVYKRLEEEA